MGSSKIISPMQASLAKAPSESGPSNTNYNDAGHVFSYGEGNEALKHLTAPPWPNNLLAEGVFSGSETKTGTIAGKAYGEGFSDKRLDPKPTSPTYKKTRR